MDFKIIFLNYFRNYAFLNISSLGVIRTSEKLDQELLRSL